MIQNEAIRQEIVALLQGKVQGVAHFHNGRTTFTDLDNELPALSVFIDEAEYQPIAACGEECDAYLKIGIYLPMFATENVLDEIAEQVANILRDASFKTVDECTLRKYSYDYDATDSAWKNSTLHFSINYIN
ncbi:tail protein [[Actinobacillus] muris]|uniref:Tail protein n=1 Tax=Muribacter muris TaxID=67855 RepID=A0A0J5P4Q0_9PAST|nr:phage tail terminator protein [Muribacter muris]KMK50414.1 tail protein [[Actinobacillus] muris] [Muribacter muris]